MIAVGNTNMLKSKVNKANALVEACYGLNLVPQRLVILAIIEAREQGEMIKAGGILRIRAQDYVTHFNVNRVTAYEGLATACEELFDSKFIWKSTDEHGNVKRHNSRFVQRASYVDAAGYVEIMFSEDIMPLITRLNERYTEYDLRQIGNLKSAYSLRIFEMLMQWVKIGKTPVVEIEDFREKLGIEDDKYQSMSDFKKRVLDPAVKEISNKTNIKVDYKQIKNGVKITGFIFIFKDKKAFKPIIKDVDKNTINALDNNVRKIPMLSDEQIEMFGDKLFKNFDFKRDIMGQAISFQGKNDEQCKNHIKKMLKNSDMTTKWSKYLFLVGFKIPK